MFGACSYFPLQAFTFACNNNNNTLSFSRSVCSPLYLSILSICAFDSNGIALLLNDDDCLHAQMFHNHKQNICFPKNHHNRGIGCSVIYIGRYTKRQIDIETQQQPTTMTTKAMQTTLVSLTLSLACDCPNKTASH